MNTGRSDPTRVSHQCGNGSMKSSLETERGNPNDDNDDTQTVTTNCSSVTVKRSNLSPPGVYVKTKKKIPSHNQVIQKPFSSMEEYVATMPYKACLWLLEHESLLLSMMCHMVEGCDSNVSDETIITRFREVVAAAAIAQPVPVVQPTPPNEAAQLLPLPKTNDGISSANINLPDPNQQGDTAIRGGGILTANQEPRTKNSMEEDVSDESRTDQYPAVKRQKLQLETS